jgi:cytochrome c biogenesis factor
VGIRLQADTSPLIWLVWTGGLVTAAGGFLALRARRVTPAPKPKAEVGRE